MNSCERWNESISISSPCCTWLIILFNPCYTFSPRSKEGAAKVNGLKASLCLDHILSLVVGSIGIALPRALGKHSSLDLINFPMAYGLQRKSSRRWISRWVSSTSKIFPKVWSRYLFPIITITNPKSRSVIHLPNETARCKKAVLASSISPSLWSVRIESSLKPDHYLITILDFISFVSLFSYRKPKLPRLNHCHFSLASIFSNPQSKCGSQVDDNKVLNSDEPSWDELIGEIDLPGGINHILNRLSQEDIEHISGQTVSLADHDRKPTNRSQSSTSLYVDLALISHQLHLMEIS